MENAIICRLISADFTQISVGSIHRKNEKHFRSDKLSLSGCTWCYLMGETSIMGIYNVI